MVTANGTDSGAGRGGLSADLRPPYASSSNLTRSQLLVWLGQQQYPDAPLYNMVITFEFPREMHADRFRAAFQGVVDDCDALRSIFEVRSGTPLRKVLDRLDCRMGYVDFSDEPQPERCYFEWFERRKLRRIDLGAMAFDTALVKLSATRFIWYLNQHHIITDGRSVSLVYDAIATRYGRLDGNHSRDTRSSDDVAPVPDTSSFEAYAVSEHRLAASKSSQRAADHWLDRARAWQTHAPLEFYGHPRRSVTTESDRVTIELGASRGKALRSLARSKELGVLTPDVSLFQILLTVLFAHVHRITGQRTVTIGALSANRSGARQRRTIGLFMQVFSLSLEIEPGETFASLHRNVQAESLVFLRYAAPGVASPQTAGAFNVVLNYAKVAQPDLFGEPVVQTFHHAGHGEPHHWLRLQVQDFEHSDTLLLELDLNRGAFGHVPRQAAAQHFIGAIDAFLADRSLEVAGYAVLPRDEYTRVIETLNKTHEPYRGKLPLIERFEHAAKTWPDRTALVSEDSRMSYRQLDRQANGLARALRHAGVSRGDVAGVILDRGADSIVAILAVLKAGGVFMPMEYDVPPLRRDLMLALAGSQVAICDPSHREPLQTLGVTCIEVDSVEAAHSPPDLGSEASDVTRPAYVLFTSGSTGEPKGVICRHLGVVNLLEDFEQIAPLPADAVCAWWTASTFDVSIYEIFSALTFGRTLWVVPDQMRADGASYLDWLARQRIQSAYAPPFMLDGIAAALEGGASYPPLERLLVGVEPIPEDTLARLYAALPKLMIVNGYGPTEATICTTLYPVPRELDGRRNTPIGRPVRNTTLYLLDDTMQPVPFGAVGEIYVGGDGLAVGYLGRAELTAERFVTAPFLAETQGPLYRTGDLGHYLADGNLMYVGRADQQLKFRGQRLEPGEVEFALREHESVREALVMIQEVNGAPTLVAYLISHSKEVLSRREWSQWLAGRLPRFMIPTAYVALDAFPSTTSGKIDRRALPLPGDVGAAANPRSAETPMERRLAEIYKEVLELSDLDMDAHFLDLGGDSIKAMQIAARACDTGITLTPRHVFDAATIGEAALLAVQDAQIPLQATTTVSRPVSAQEMEDILAQFGEDPEDELNG